MDVDIKHAAWDFLYNTKYHWGDNLEVHYSKFIWQTKFATEDQVEFMLKTARTHFIRLLLQDLMREAGLRSFPCDAEMLRHLKRCMQFSCQPKKMVTALNTSLEGNPDDVVEELSVERRRYKHMDGKRQERHLPSLANPSSNSIVVSAIRRDTIA